MRSIPSAPKVCFATSYYDTLGGLAKSARRIVRFLADEGFDVYVITSDVREGGFLEGPDKQPALSPSLEDGIHVYRVPITVKKEQQSDFGYVNYVWIQSFYQTIRDLDNIISFDIYHGFYFSMAYPCILVAGNKKRPVIASIRGNEIEQWAVQPWGLPYVTLVLQKASWITTVGTELLDIGKALVDITDRSSFIPNSIERSCFPRWHATETNCGVVGTVARFAKFKDIPTLIQAYANVATEAKQKLLLVGDFPEEDERAKVEYMINHHELAPEVQITGFITDPRKITDYLMAMRVFVVSSSIDGMPNSLLEAAAAGVPLVATCVSGLKDILKDGESAMLVPPKDYKKLAQAIDTVLQYEYLAKKLSMGALKLAEDFNPDKEKAAWVDLYNQLLPAS